MTGSSPQADRQRGNDGMTSSHNRPRVGRHLPGSWGLLPILMGLCVVLWTWRASGANQAPASEVGGVRARQGETPPRDSARPVGAADERAEFVRLMNTGKAHLENGSFDKAVESLTAALEIRPRSTPALRNLARAYLFSGELDLAIERLAEAREAEPGSVATAYLTGLALARQTRFEAATPYFEQAARLDAAHVLRRLMCSEARHRGSRQRHRVLHVTGRGDGRGVPDSAGPEHRQQLSAPDGQQGNVCTNPEGPGSHPGDEHDDQNPIGRSS